MRHALGAQFDGIFFDTYSPAYLLLLSGLYALLIMNIAANPKPLFRFENRVTGFKNPTRWVDDWPRQHLELESTGIRFGVVLEQLE